MRVFAQVHAPEQPAHTNSSSPPSSSWWPWNRKDSGSIPPDDKEKVYDAIIVAAGIVAVLIANVAYVGESCLSRSTMKELVCMLRQWLLINVMHTNSFCTIMSFTLKYNLMQAVSHTFECMHILHAPECIPIHVGYLTPPGAQAYWGDCWYPLYIAFIVCNGFALVFAVAAIAAVLVGPLALVCLDRKTWRKQIAILATIHSVISLATFVAAFALTGFLSASVDAPPFNCGNLKCADGGVPCSPYMMKRNGDVFARYNWASKAFEEVGTDLGNTPSTVESRNQTQPRYELVLDPVIAQLNNKTFGSNGLGETLGNVVCRDYRYLAKTLSRMGRPMGRPHWTA